MTGQCRLAYLILTIYVWHSYALVQSPPRIVKQPPTDEVLFQNDKPFIIECEAECEPNPQYSWTKNGKPFDWQTYDDRISQQTGRGSLVFTSPHEEDAGQYQCFAQNELGIATANSVFVRKAELESFKASQPMNVTVSATVPYFTVEPQIANVAEDETVEFRCEASGLPEPEIKWIYNGKSISEAPPNPRRKVSTNSIIIENLVKGDTGNYGCNATNSLGYVYKDVYVNVLALAPEISEPPHDLETVVGATVTLKCTVFGAPKPEVKWTRAGRELTGGRYTVTEYGELQIKDVQSNDAGEYTCNASNKFGSVEESCSLVVKAVAALGSEI